MVYYASPTLYTGYAFYFDDAGNRMRRCAIQYAIHRNGDWVKTGSVFHPDPSWINLVKRAYDEVDNPTIV